MIHMVTNVQLKPNGQQCSFRYKTKS